MIEALRPDSYLAFLYDVGELPDPDEAVVRSDEQEAVSAVQRGRSGLHQPDLDVSSPWFHINTDRWLISGYAATHRQDYHTRTIRPTWREADAVNMTIHRA